MTKIKKSYLTVYSLCLLLIFPGLVRWAKIKTRHYSYDSKNLFIEEGVFSKNSMTIPLIKIESIQTRSNILGNGTLQINAKVASKNAQSMFSLEYIRGAKKAKNQLWEAVENAKSEQGVKAIDTF